MVKYIKYITAMIKLAECNVKFLNLLIKYNKTTLFVIV